MILVFGTAKVLGAVLYLTAVDKKSEREVASSKGKPAITENKKGGPSLQTAHPYWLFTTNYLLLSHFLNHMSNAATGHLNMQHGSYGSRNVGHIHFAVGFALGHIPTVKQ